MAEKKTTQRVLSERALELVMLNVLGGLDGMLQHELNPERNNCHSDSTDSFSLESTHSTPQQLDPKLS